MSCVREDKCYIDRKALLIVTNLQAQLKCLSTEVERATEIHPMYSKDISKAHGRHAYGINPGSYTAWGFAETLKVPAEALPQEKTPQRSTRTRHCTQDSGGQKVCVWSRWGTGRGCGTFEGMLWDPKEGEARAWSLLGSWQHHLIQPQPHHCTPFYP